MHEDILSQSNRFDYMTVSRIFVRPGWNKTHIINSKWNRYLTITLKDEAARGRESALWNAGQWTSALGTLGMTRSVRFSGHPAGFEAKLIHTSGGPQLEVLCLVLDHCEKVTWKFGYFTLTSHFWDQALNKGSPFVLPMFPVWFEKHSNLMNWQCVLESKRIGSSFVSVCWNTITTKKKIKEAIS